MTFLDDLRHIDPAGPPDPDAHRHSRARRMAEQTMDHAIPFVPARRRAARRGLLLAAAAAAAVVGALVFVPGLTGGDAYSSWTAVPTPASNEVRAQAADSCRDQVTDRPVAPGQDSGVSAGEDEGVTEVAIAEQRGVFTYVVLNSATARAGCLFEGDVDDPVTFSGSIVNLAGYTEPESDGISEASLTVSAHDGDHLVFLSARIGHQVQAAELHVPGIPGTVHASVEDGILAAWVPAWLPEPGGITLRLHLADGASVELDQDEIYAAGRGS